MPARELFKNVCLRYVRQAGTSGISVDSCHEMAEPMEVDGTLKPVRLCIFDTMKEWQDQHGLKVHVPRHVGGMLTLDDHGDLYV